MFFLFWAAVLYGVLKAIAIVAGVLLKALLLLTGAAVIVMAVRWLYRRLENPKAQPLLLT